jgi:hypothetical protein
MSVMTLTMDSMFPVNAPERASGIESQRDATLARLVSIDSIFE